MKYISDELERIAGVLNVQYERASSIEQANILLHSNNQEPIIIYVGHGESKHYYEGAEPLQQVPVEIYCLVRKNVKDALAKDIDAQLSLTSSLVSNILYELETSRDTLEYSTEPVEIGDDMYIGQLLRFSPIIPDNAC